MTSVFVRRTDVVLRPDPSRVIAKIFLPGQEPTTTGVSRAAGVVQRCLALGEGEVEEELAEIMAGFGSRHRHFDRILDAHFAALAHRVEGSEELSTERRRLIGAYFTQEYAHQSAALFNPSVVAHPEQDVAPGSLRFLMSARAVGEGHLSSIVFGSGVLGPGTARTATVTVDRPSGNAMEGEPRDSLLDRERFRIEATASDVDPGSLTFVLDALAPQFTLDALDGALAELQDQQLTRVNIGETLDCLRLVATSSYTVGFPAGIPLSDRVLTPSAPVESHGIEDARFVRFTDDRGASTYLATYTAYDGSGIVSRRLETDDFLTFRASAFTGRAATNKGMALFPRLVGGHHLALSRWDRENNAIAVSADGYGWHDVRQVQAPEQPWELIQLGNCGSPIETPQGWLVLTHGVGAMRSYSIGALLLDLDDPWRVIGRLAQPLLRPAPDERDGYVPNVVYSCGALVHGQTLLLPYGCSDSTIRIALVDLPELLDRLTENPTVPTPPGETLT
ncbi:MAG: glycoside hydrolase family 130 protein [Kineosporiaceae bacterium]